MRVTAATLAKIVGGKASAGRTSNIASIISGLDAYGQQAGLTTAPRLAQYIAQVAHESGRFVYDREIWGPTPAQARYDTRTDLGNTAAVDGDGKKNAGIGPIQITGGANIKAFYQWCLDRGLPAPDFVANPLLIATDPWEGIGPIWYWSTRNLNRYADEGNIETVTEKINGGLNGYKDRIALFVRAALVFLDYKLDAGVLKRFQAEHGLLADDNAGPATRAALHAALVKLDALPAPSDNATVVIVPAAPEPQPAPVDVEEFTALDLIEIIEDATARLRRLTDVQA